MYTYKDFTRKDTPLEDVWRLGILILVFLKPRVKQLVERYHLQPPEKNYFQLVLSASKKRKHIDTATMLAPYVYYQKHILTSYDPDKKLWKTLFPVVMQMLHADGCDLRDSRTMQQPRRSSLCLIRWYGGRLRGTLLDVAPTP